MAVRKHPRRLKLRRWPGEDWDYTHVSYRIVKTVGQYPVTWLARLNARGAEHIPDEGPVILAVNHLSWADPFAMGAILKRPAFYLAKEGVFRHPLTRWLVTAAGQIKIDRMSGGNDAALSTAVDVLAHGLILGVFPEGTRSRPGHVKRGKTGVARIAALSGAPIVPVGCETGAFWPRGRAVPRVGEPVYVNVGEPFRLDVKPEHVSDKQRMRDATDEVMGRIRTLYKEAVAAREAGERWG